MNTTIYKYTLKVTDEQTVMLPEGARVLSVANQGDDMVLYAHVDPRKPENAKVRVFIYGTGNPAIVPDTARFMGTFSQRGGRLMWHVFAEGGEDGG